MGKLLGIDYGTKRIGIAVSDTEGTVAFPKAIVENTTHVLSQIVDLLKEEQVTGIVVGESKDFEGNNNAIVEQARAFGARLREATGLMLFFEDETLSSVQAEKMLRTTKRPEDQRNNTRYTDAYDASAAAIILQSYLDKQKHHGNETDNNL